MRSEPKEPLAPIAITGIGCRFPGDANDPQSFWDLLCQGVDAITEIPQDRWCIDRFYDPQPGVPGKTNSKWGGFIKGIDEFEPECFGISPREAVYIDPQQRLLLEVAWEALEDGGQSMELVGGTRTGVFIGISTSDYAQVQLSPWDTRVMSQYHAAGGAVSIAANRISYCLNLRGPSVAVDTACSSSLTAIHLACQSIWNRECDQALAGGVNILLSPIPFVVFSAGAYLSPDGRCKAFDASANGFVRSEGAGIIVLKPLSQAQADGDPVYAVILSTSANQDGRTTAMPVPNQTAQESLLRDACRHARIDPGAITYVETHGTGTAIGDPIEARSLGNVLRENRPKGQFCIIGSAKTNVGHMEAAAGVVGAIKAALVLKHRMIPPNLHFVNPNPDIPFEELQLRVPQTLETWPDSQAALVGVNSFGFGGANAHLVMQQAPDGRTVSQNLLATRVYLLPLSARTPEGLQTLARSYRVFLQSDSHASIEDICYTASLRKSHSEQRLSLVAGTPGDLMEGLDAYLAGERRPGMSFGSRSSGHESKLAFVLSGQGPQWWGMGRELLEAEPVFRSCMESCDALLRTLTGWSLLSELSADESHSRLQQTAIAQPALFALQVSLAALWKSWGIEPHAVVGHSLGETAASHISGGMSLEQAVRVIYHRSRCMELASSEGRMLAVGCSSDHAERAIQGYEDRVSVAAVNSPSSTTLSGNAEALEEIAQVLSQSGTFVRFIQVKYAFHSPQMDPVQNDLLEALGGLEPRPGAVPMISTVTGKIVDGPLGGDYWWRNIRETVRFAEAFDWLIREGFNTFLELGPHPVLSGYISECLQHVGKQGIVVPSLRRQESERSVMLGSFGGLYASGFKVDWHRLWPSGGRFVSLPKYPWQRQRYWHESQELSAYRLGDNVFPLLGRNIGSADPSWKIALDKRSLRYLDDHRVRDHAVFPAAGYVEMVLEAAHASLEGKQFVLEEIQFQKALFLADGGVPIVSLSYHPADGSFAIQSKESDSDSKWTVHAIGYVRAESSPNPPGTADLEAIKENLKEEISTELCYRLLDQIGLHYGPSFQGMERLWRRDGEALGQISLDRQIENEERKYCFHPVLLDSCIQAFVATLSRERAEDPLTLYLPVQIDRVHFYRRPQQRVWSHVVLTNQRTNFLEGDVRVYDEGGIVMSIDGYRCQAMKGKRSEDPHAVHNLFYQVNWHHKRRPEESVSHRSASWMPGPRDIAQSLASEAFTPEGAWLESMSTVAERFDRLSVAYLVQALRELGWQWSPGASVMVDELMQKLHIAKLYRRLARRYMRLLEKSSYLTSVGTDTWVVDRELTCEAPEKLWREVLWSHPAFLAELSLISRCGSHLPAALRGETDVLLLLFPEGSLATAEHFYQDSPLYRFYNIMVQKAVRQALDRLPEEQTLRVLEVGAGTGGMTGYVLPELAANRTEYVYSDTTQLFLHKAEEKFRDYPFLRYQLLNIEADPLQQGFEANSFDLILASDALHATRDIRDALRNILKVLSSQGLFVLMEAEWVSEPSWIDLVFGLTAEWWRFEDEDLRRDYPLLRKAEWKVVLEDVGFRDPVEITGVGDENESVHVVLLAQGPKTTSPPVTEGRALEQLPQAKRCDWLIFADQDGIAAELALLLRAQGEACFLVRPADSFRCLDAENFEVAPESPHDMRRLLQTIVESRQSKRLGAIHLWNLDAEPLTSLSTLQRAEILGCHCIIHLLKAWSMFDAAPLDLRLVLVTRGAQPVSQSDQPVAIDQAPLIGLGRMIAHENPSVHCKTVDLDLVKHPDEVRSLFEELWTEDPEEEIALRNSARFAPRVERLKAERLPVGREKPPQEEARAFRVEISTPGIMDNLTRREVKRRPPGPDEIEIEVQAAALNFRDIMKVLGLDPSETDDQHVLGSECAGKIVRVGSQVKSFQIGDEVVGIASATVGSHVTTSASLVIPKPKGMTLEDAVTMPVAFMTAYYSLHYLARARPGERLLIHSATGGVGLAALQIAQDLGLEIFATAGNAEKRELLRLLDVPHIMDSRSLSFADEISKITRKAGVDIVLNSLAGKAIHKSIACLAPFGRFLELGKRDIYENSKLGLRGFRKNLSFFVVDLTGMVSVQWMLTELSRAADTQSVRPLPHRVFPVTRTVEAVRYMAQAKHAGKIVISMAEAALNAEPLDPPSLVLRADATYIITGGLGGFGLTLARWIIERGGRNIVLVGRKAASAETQQVLADLQSTGARVVFEQADVADPEAMSKIFASIDNDMPALAGVFHTAMVLDDGILTQLDGERFRKVIAPKMDGAWNLHALTAHRSLDFFVLFSSGSSLIGTPAQGNYVAANIFLDNLAHYRRSLGMPAITVNWGRLTEIGYVARTEGLSDLLEQKGLLGISPKRAMQALDRVLQMKATQLGVMAMDWQKLAAFLPKATLAHRLSSVVKTSGSEQQGQDEGNPIREILRQAKPEAREEIIQTYIQAQVARVLGTATAKLDPDRPLTELGLDSLMGIELKNRIERDLAVSLPTHELMEGPTIKKLAKLALDRVGATVGSPPVPGSDPNLTGEQAMAVVEKLTDEEVDSLLDQMVDDKIDETPSAKEMSP